MRGHRQNSLALISLFLVGLLLTIWGVLAQSVPGAVVGAGWMLFSAFTEGFSRVAAAIRGRREELAQVEYAFKCPVNIQSLIAQIHLLGKCGISTMFSPAFGTDHAARREWSFKAAAVLSGFDLEEFETENWKRMIAIVRKEEIPERLYDADGFTKAEQLIFLPVLAGARQLYETAYSGSMQYAGSTIMP